ncbi:MAG: protein-tyrosine kinase [Blastocatellia bacterium]|jgi:Mrp family chromosome partitioning ATPase|nr:protein-tyrosine kinase [Blastocatellia bacterium]
MPVARIRSNGHRRHNLQLLLANLQNSTQRLRGGAAIAFTSASVGEGVSHVTQLFAVELARHTGRRTLIVSAERMQSLGVEDYLRMPWNCHPTNIENVWMLPSKNNARKKDNDTDDDAGPELPQRSFLMRVSKEGEDIDTGLDSVDALRVAFDNILIDCRSLRVSSEAAVLSASVDGVAVVVEAGQTRRDEILNAQRTIENAGGKFLGFVLNKRRYPVPEWLYRRL